MEEVTDIAELIHRGGIFKDVEGNTPEVIYEKVSKMIKLPEEMTAEQITAFLKLLKSRIAESAGKMMSAEIKREPTRFIARTIMIAVITAIIRLYKSAFVPVAFAKVSSKVTEKMRL